MGQSCVEYWESLDIDPLDAAMTAGCSTAPSPTNHDVIGGLIFLLLLAIAAIVTYRSEPVDDKYDPFR